MEMDYHDTYFKIYTPSNISLAGLIQTPVLKKKGGKSYFNTLGPPLERVI